MKDAVKHILEGKDVAEALQPQKQLTESAKGQLAAAKDKADRVMKGAYGRAMIKYQSDYIDRVRFYYMVQLRSGEGRSVYVEFTFDDKGRIEDTWGPEEME